MTKLHFSVPIITPPLLGLLITLPLLVISQNLDAELSILLQVKQQLGNPPSIQSWNSSSSPCDWPEITCTDNTVTAISLYGKSITHKIPARICDLKNLMVLDVSNNYIPGEFPDILNCSKLEYLLLLQNYFVGPIPADIDRLSRLRYLDLTANNFSGDIPQQLGDYGSCSTCFWFKMTLPKEFGALKKLTYLWMTEANLVGEIPESFNNLLSLEHLDLAHNKLDGTIPGGMLMADTSGFREATKFDGFESFLESVVRRDTSKSFGLHSELRRFEVSENKLSGELPQHLCARGALLGVVASNNNLSGGSAQVPRELHKFALNSAFQQQSQWGSAQVPRELHKFALNSAFQQSLFRRDSFRHLDIPGHGIGDVRRKFILGDTSKQIWQGICPEWTSVTTREIPVELTSLPSISTLSLDGNQLSGQLPLDIISWKSLFALNLSTNYLSGPIPKAIGSLPSLVFLDLSENQFSGEIPHEFSHFVPNTFNLSSNNLSGEIPPAFEKWEYESSFLNNPNLCANIQILKSCHSKARKVYRTTINHSGEVVAVKWILTNRKLGQNLEKQFVAEVQILDRWLHGKKRAVSSMDSGSDVVLDWPMRLQIAIGAARGYAICTMIALPNHSSRCEVQQHLIGL
ncbi:LRR receptor-like serine/threonine-protein kinase HSL2 [Vitis vinifera]|uniref:LRR receptor-like serine/threonine-protein kinase HSL2 n=1 Tax=Vitis vinifera TaxID=29760 RepID=A0A438BQH9_VITVI|nr:LRR receptor-like serine/threonine-protein kinase HSL2 [Vitis vinifera]